MILVGLKKDLRDAVGGGAGDGERKFVTTKEVRSCFGKVNAS